MTQLDIKLDTIQAYILAKKGIRVVITFKDGDNSRELAMVEHAFLYAKRFFETQVYGK